MRFGLCIAVLLGLVVVNACPMMANPVVATPKTIVLPALIAASDKTMLESFSAVFGFDLAMKPGPGASCVLVSRDLQEDGFYIYRGLTAHHVIDDLSNALDKDPGTDRTVTFTGLGWDGEFQFEAEINPDWLFPARDWSSFTFESDLFLECTEVATKAEFESIGPLDHIYIVSNPSSQGVLIRETNIGAPHNRWPSNHINNASPWPWASHPNDYFRAMGFIWYGSSGGAVFNKEGKLIGIINAISIFGGYHQNPTGHPAIALKSYVIRELVDNINENFFVIEGEK